MTAPLSDPPGASAITGAVDWLQGTLLGTLATTVAVIAVASVGLLMLSGRIPYRRGATVILGCFIVFGASGIAGGLRSAAGGGGPAPQADVAPAPPPAPPEPPPRRQAVPAAADPYAGASVPVR